MRNYRDEDKEFLVGCIIGMQAHVFGIDSIKKTRPVIDFNAKQYVENLLKRVKENKGQIYIAEYGGKRVGCVAGIIKETAEADLIDEIPCRAGRIIELFVEPDARGKNIGSRLIEKMEMYFHENHCDMAELGVFITNTAARKLYDRLGYIDRNVEMCKKF